MPKDHKRITLADIAREAGLSRTAVSYALRNDPNSSKETRKHVKAIAEKLGYHPDPIISKLMLKLHGERTSSPGSRIAFLNVSTSPTFIRDNPALRDCFHSAKIRAEEHGYGTEEFWLFEPGRSPERLASILRNRGIQGILVGSTGYPDSHMDFPMEHFTAVTLGYSVTQPKMHRVTTHQYENAQLAIQKVKEAGYQNIGLLVDTEREPGMRNLHIAALLIEHYESPRKKKCPPCLGKEHLADWYRSKRPDAILNGTLIKGKDFIEAGVPATVPIISLVSGEDESAAARINQRYDILGRIAVNLIADQLLHDQAGIPDEEQIIMIRGTWEKLRGFKKPPKEKKSAP